MTKAWTVGFPVGPAGDRVAEGLLACLDLDGLEALHVTLGKLGQRGIEPDAVQGVLDGSIELAAAWLTAGWFVLLAAHPAARRIDVLGAVRAADQQPALERAARRGLGRLHAPLEWLR